MKYIYMRILPLLIMGLCYMPDMVKNREWDINSENCIYTVKNN